MLWFRKKEGIGLEVDAEVRGEYRCLMNERSSVDVPFSLFLACNE